MAKVRVNATMEPETVARIDEYARKMGINRSAAICVLTGQALDGQDGIRALSQLADQMRKEEEQVKVSQSDQSAPPKA